MKDLADRWGVSYEVIRQWRTRGKLPEPDWRLGMQVGWDELTISEWEQDELGASTR